MAPDEDLPPAELLAERRRELAVFLFLIVPPMIVAYFAGSRHDTFVIFAVSSVLTDLAFVSLVLFFLWRNGEPLSRCGLGSVRLGRELLIGVLLYPPLAITLVLLESAFQQLGFSAPSHAPPRFLAVHGGAQLALASVLVLVVAIAEEILFRGYLLLRFSELQRSTGRAIVASAAVFSIGHLYEGTAGVLVVGLMGVALGIIRVWRGSLVAPIVIHMLQDMLAIVIVPALHR